MHRWAVEGVFTFNLLMACVDVAGLWFLHRFRKAAAWWIAAFFAAGASFLLVCLFNFGPSFISRISMAGFRNFPVVRLVAYVIFLHGPICALGGALLLRKKAPKTALLSAATAAALVLMAVDAFWIEPTWLEVTHLRIESPKLSRPIRVAVVADLQTDQAGSYERKVFTRLRAEKPDLILLAGDYVQAPPSRVEAVCRELNALVKDVGLDAPEGVFAVQGNVDARRPWRKIFDGLPVVPVISTQSFDIGPLQLTCLSMGESFHPAMKIERKNADRFHLVLGHGPVFARGQIDADLLVAGHTHGGQVRLPGFGAIQTGCDVPRHWAAGLTTLPSGAQLLVSRGVGMERGHAPRLRFLCRPQLILIDLVPVPR
ncbi:MAG: metallophosphoesterase [Pirellulales bacterium]|nr:metallophosphoesterase [Pirellulales bacterium]